MIEDVEELGSELDDLVLTDPRSFHHREVENDVARSMEHVATETAESGWRSAYKANRTGCEAKRRT